MTNTLFGPPGLILLAAIIGAVGALWAAQRQAEFEHKLGTQNAEIAALNKQLLDAVTGGESFPELSVFLNNGTNHGNMAVTHHGKDPLFDLTARVTDLDLVAELERAPHLTLERVAATGVTLLIGTLVPGYVAMQAPIDLGTANHRAFNIDFVARNGGFRQEYRLARTESGWTSASRVVRSSDGRIMIEKVRADFPKGSSGQVEW